MPNRKGTGKAGGGLVARIKVWESESPNGYVRNGNGVPNVRHNKPGSQNSAKGGPGK
jgi:hypothetical protein